MTNFLGIHMDMTCTTETMLGVESEFSVILADTPELLTEVFQLRNQVYCLERGFEISSTGLETDIFDQSARHILLRHRATQVAVGATRIVMLRPEAPGTSFPMQHVCPITTLQNVPLRTTGEVSRFSLSKHRLSMLGAAAGLTRLSLINGLMQVSQQAGLTHWCALMERSLLRLLRGTGVHFQPLGPQVEHKGLRQPSLACISDVMARMHEEARPAWDYITAKGTLLQTMTQVNQA